MKQDLQIEILEKQSTIFIDDDNLSALYYPETKIMHFIWKQRTIGDPYRKAFMDGAEFGKDHPTKFFLSDIRNQGVVGTEDRKWFESVALPAAIERGVTRVAVVFEGNVFKMYYINMLLKRFANKGVPMKFFNELELAEDWLLSE